MTDRTDDFRAADEALRLRLFDEPLPAEASPEAHADAFAGDDDAIEGEGAFEGELPDDLLALADRLASESRSLAMTYPASSPERLPIGEAALAPPSPVEMIAPEAEAAVGVRDEVSPSRRRIFGVGTAAAIGFAAILGAAIYSATVGGPRDSVAEMTLPEIEESGVDVSPSLGSAASEAGGVSVRTVSLSLANDGDYRRLESVLRDRSEPEREAMFDLLQEEGDSDETAVRISF